jgi:hypothetical protein
LKKLIAICILAVLLFNSVGYRLLCHFLQQSANQQMQAQIEQGNYTSTALLELSAPLHLPYSTNWTEWEKFEGDIEIEGVHYRYVERKLADGRIYVRCLPNTARQQVVNARDQFAMLAYNVNQPAKTEKHSSIFVSNYIGDYDDSSSLNWSFQFAHRPAAPLHAFRHPAVGIPFLEAPCIPPEFHG